MPLLVTYYPIHTDYSSTFPSSLLANTVEYFRGANISGCEKHSTTRFSSLKGLVITTAAVPRQGAAPRQDVCKLKGEWFVGMGRGWVGRGVLLYVVIMICWLWFQNTKFIILYRALQFTLSEYFRLTWTFKLSSDTSPYKSFYDARIYFRWPQLLYTWYLTVHPSTFI